MELSKLPMRLTLKGDVKPGALLHATLAIGHPMESGFRTLESGQRVPKHVIETIAVRLGDELVLQAQTGIGISAHPYLVFPIFLPARLTDATSQAPLRLMVTWLDDKGQRGELVRALL